MRVNMLLELEGNHSSRLAILWHPDPLNLVFFGGILLYVTYIFRGVFRGWLIVT